MFLQDFGGPRYADNLRLYEFWQLRGDLLEDVAGSATKKAVGKRVPLYPFSFGVDASVLREEWTLSHPCGHRHAMKPHAKLVYTIVCPRSGRKVQRKTTTRGLGGWNERVKCNR